MPRSYYAPNRSDADAAQDSQLFKTRVIQVLAHNPLVNRAWVETFTTPAQVDTTASSLTYDADWQAMLMPSGALSGVYQSVLIRPTGVYRIRYACGMLDGYLPDGCTALLELSTNGRDFYPLPLTGSPTLLPVTGTVLQVRVTLTRPNLVCEPLLTGVAVLFEDYNTGHTPLSDGTMLVPASNYDGPEVTQHAG